MKNILYTINILFIMVLFFVGGAWAAVKPERPREYVNTTYVEPDGRIIRVPDGGDFQAAIDQAQPGDIIELEAGGTYTPEDKWPRSFFLRKKNNPGKKYIVIRSSAFANLPGENERVSPNDAQHMPLLTKPADVPPLLEAERGASYYRLIGLEFMHNSGSEDMLAIIRLGHPSINSASEQPHHIIIDRSYIHSGPGTPSKRRGVEIQGRSQAVINSYISQISHKYEAQAIAGWNGTGPFKIVNNYLEAAGENFIYGGADTKIPNNIPSDFEIRRNHLFKPLLWRNNPAMTVKNLFEIKNASRVLIEGNIFENTWTDSDQRGWAIVITPRNQEGSNPWSRTNDITFTNNIIKHANLGMQIGGAHFPLERILVENNLFVDMHHKWGGDGVGFFLLNAGHSGANTDITINHNTFLNTPKNGDAMRAGTWPNPQKQNRNIVMTNNIWKGGVNGDGGCGGSNCSKHFTNLVLGNNIQWNEDMFVDFGGENYRLKNPSQFSGTDGKPAGVDVDVVFSVIGGTSSSAPSQQVPPASPEMPSPERPTPVPPVSSPNLPPEEPLPLSDNVALHKLVTSSGGEFDSGSFSRVNDGVTNVLGQYWAAKGAPNWVVIDLEKTHSIDRIKVNPFGRGEGIYYYNASWSVKYATDSDPDTFLDFTGLVVLAGTASSSGMGVSIKNGDPGTGRADSGYQHYAFKFNVVNARYIKFEVTGGDVDLDTNLDEIEVFEAATSLNPSGSTNIANAPAPPVGLKVTLN